MAGKWRKAGLCLLLIFLVTLPHLPALALLVRPVLLDLTSSGSGASGSLEVVNDRNRPVAVEVKVNRMTLNERGAPVLTPDAGDDFQIFPPIGNIPAGGRQVFRIRWIGEPNLPESQLFMFQTSELPVASTPGQAQVQVLFAISSVVAVRPAAARPDISIVNVQRATNRDGQAGVYITFENSGPGHGYVNRSRIDLGSSAGWSRTFRSTDLGALGLGLVPPNGRRAMFLPITDLPAEGDLSGRIEMLPTR